MGWTTDDNNINVFVQQNFIYIICTDGNIQFRGQLLCLCLYSAPQSNYSKTTRVEDSNEGPYTGSVSKYTYSWNERKQSDFVTYMYIKTTAVHNTN